MHWLAAEASQNQQKNKQTNKQASKQNKQTNKQTNTQTNKQNKNKTNKQNRTKQTNEQTNTQTTNQTNKQTNKSDHEAGTWWHHEEIWAWHPGCPLWMWEGPASWKMCLTVLLKHWRRVTATETAWEKFQRSLDRARASYGWLEESMALDNSEVQSSKGPWKRSQWCVSWAWWVSKNAVDPVWQWWCALWSWECSRRCFWVMLGKKPTTCAQLDDGWPESEKGDVTAAVNMMITR